MNIRDIAILGQVLTLIALPADIIVLIILMLRYEWRKDLNEDGSNIGKITQQFLDEQIKPLIEEYNGHLIITGAFIWVLIIQFIRWN